MKKMISLLFACTLFAFLSMGCSKDDGDEKENGNGKNEEIHSPTKMTWEKLVEKYPFMGQFPKYDGDIEMPQYNKTYNLESVGFFDYKCEAAMATRYYAKLAAAGFTVNPNAKSIYTKTTDGKTFTFTGAHAAGNFGMVFSCQPKN